MRRSFRPAAALTGALAIAACGPVEITLQLRAGVNSDDLRADTSAIETVRIVLADETGEQDNLVLPVVRDKPEQLPDVAVERSRPFSVDVWGCTVEGRCNPADVVFRGCQLVDLSEQAFGSRHVIPVDVIEADDVKVRECPPRPVARE